MTNFVGVDLHRNNFTYCIRVNGEERKIVGSSNLFSTIFAMFKLFFEVE